MNDIDVVLGRNYILAFYDKLIQLGQEKNMLFTVYSPVSWSLIGLNKDLKEKGIKAFSENSNKFPPIYGELTDTFLWKESQPTTDNLGYLEVDKSLKEFIKNRRVPKKVDVDSKLINDLTNSYLLLNELNNIDLYKAGLAMDQLGLEKFLDLSILGELSLHFYLTKPREEFNYDFLDKFEKNLNSTSLFEYVHLDKKEVLNELKFGCIHRNLNFQISGKDMMKTLKIKKDLESLALNESCIGPLGVHFRNYHFPEKLGVEF